MQCRITRENLFLDNGLKPSAKTNKRRVVKAGHRAEKEGDLAIREVENPVLGAQRLAQAGQGLFGHLRGRDPQQDAGETMACFPAPIQVLIKRVAQVRGGIAGAPPVLREWDKAKKNKG